MSTGRPASDDRPFRYPAFRRYLVARSLSRASSQILAVAVGWQIYDLTHSTKALGLIGLAQFLPMLLLTLPAGHTADLRDRRRVAALFQTATALIYLILILLTVTHRLTAGQAFLLVAAISGCRAFENPALIALAPAMVPAEIFSAATATTTSVNQAAIMLAPAIGGLLYGISPAVPYAVSGASLAICALLMGLLPPGPEVQKPAPGLKTVFAGIAFIRSKPSLLGAISLDLFAVLLGGATALMPVFARDILHAGPVGLGLLRGAPALGSLGLSLVLARFPLTRRQGRKMFAAVIVFGVATILFGLSTWLPLSILCLAILGAADMVSVVVRQVLVQLQTPDAMRGRVSAVNSLFIGTSNQLGEFESGMTAWLFGTVPAVLIGGFGTIGIALLWMRLFPQLRDLDRVTQAE